VAFTAPAAGIAADNQFYEHISRVLARFDLAPEKVSLAEMV
jgi:hypothetical protein